MRLIQINAWGGKLKYQLIDFLKEQNADLVCIQEAMDYNGPGGAFLGMANEMAAGADYKHRSFASTYSFSYMGQEIEFGNAILSKVPITDESVIFTEGKYFRHYDMLKDSYNIRNLQVVKIDIDGKQLTVMNHHGHHIPGTKQGNGETMRQMKILATEISKVKGPLILTGDFNLAPDSPSMNVINQALENLCITNNIKRTYTHLSSQNVVCDYIFVNPAVKSATLKKALATTDEL